MADRILIADGPHGALYAGISPYVAYVTPKVADHRLTAVLAPFRDEEAARAALIAAGGSEVREWLK